MRGDEGSCEGGSGVGEAEKGDKGGKHGGQQQEQKREEGKMKEKRRRDRSRWLLSV
jgi:hypothetical protein